MRFERWLSELRDVNPSGETPHKPLLLLTVLKAAERDGELPEVLLLSPELVYQFKLSEHIIAHRWKQKLDIASLLLIEAPSYMRRISRRFKVQKRRRAKRFVALHERSLVVRSCQIKAVIHHMAFAADIDFHRIGK